MKEQSGKNTLVGNHHIINSKALIPASILWIIFIWVMWVPNSAAASINPDLVYLLGDERVASHKLYQLETTRVIGIVSDAVNNQSLGSAMVVINDSESHVYTTTTSTSGWYTFTETITNPIASGSATLQVSKAGYRSASVNTSIESGVDNRQDIQLDTTDLVVTKSDGKTTVRPGQTITYTITITNVGTISATNILITDVLPSSLSYISNTLGVTPTIPIAGTYVWAFPTSLDQDDIVSFQLKAKVANALSGPTAQIRNTVEVSTSSPEANQTNNTAEDINSAIGTPNVGISISVSPSQVRTGFNANYSIRVTNTGDVLVTDVVVEDTFSIYLDLVSATTTKGTATRNNTTRKVTAEFSPLSPNETVTISVIGRVNNTSNVNRTITNQATVEYLFGGAITSKTSNVTSFQLLATSTLPATGGRELMENESLAFPTIFRLVLLIGVFLILVGISALGYSTWIRESRVEWSAWYFRMGFVIASIGVVFSIAYIGLTSFYRPSVVVRAHLFEKSDISKQVYMPLPEEGPVWPSNSPLEEQLALPDFPVPTQTELNLQDPSDETPDISPVNRIIIPVIAVNTIVKYVPYDGFTWAIAGLRDEVAWMGETSWPGLVGNTALAGHVSLWDGREGPFRHIDKLTSGDRILIQTDENIYSYQVRETKIVLDTDLFVLDPVYDQQLTLITCTGWNPEVERYLERLVIVAELADSKPLSQEFSSQ